MTLKFRNFKYYIKSAIFGMWRNGVMTFASLITVTSCLLMFGVFMLFSANMNFIGEQIQAQCEIQAFIDIDATANVEKYVLDTISSLDNVKEATFESKSDAMENYRRFLGVDATALNGLDGDNFLRSSVKVIMKDLRLADELAEQISEINGVAEVKNRRDLVQKVISVTDVIRQGSLVFMAILLIIAIFIISNTIKLSVYAREEEIHIMKFVGATDGFIRKPFVIEGMIIGCIGGGISILLVSLGYNLVVNAMTDFLDIFELCSLSEMLPLLTAITVCFGLFMGAIGSVLSIKKHLKV